MKKQQEVFYDDDGKVLDLSGPALRKQDALESKKTKKVEKSDEAKPLKKAPKEPEK